MSRGRVIYGNVISPLPFIHYLEFQFAQRPVHVNMQMLRDPNRLWSLLMDPTKEVTWIEEIPDIEDAVVLRISTKSAVACQPRFVNPAIGAFDQFRLLPAFDRDGHPSRQTLPSRPSSIDRQSSNPFPVFSPTSLPGLHL